MSFARTPFTRKHPNGKRHFAPFVFFKNSHHPLPKGQGIFGSLMFSYYFAAAATSFIAAYLNEKGISGTQVGIIMAVVNAFGILSSPIAGAVSDKLSSPRKVVMLCLIGSSIFYLFVPILYDIRFVAIPLGVALLPIWSLFKTPIQSLTDSLTIEYVNTKRTFSYGSVRYLGSLGYSFMCIIFGVIATKTDTQANIFWLYPLLNIPVILILFRLRSYESGGSSVTRAKSKDGGLKLALQSYYFKMFLITHTLLSLPVYCLGTFLPYELLKVAGSTHSMGTVIAIKSFMEIPTLIFGARFVERFGLRKMLFISGCIFIVEQSIYIFAQSIIPVTAALMLHGFTYGLYLSCAINYIFRTTPHEANASAQTIAGALTALSAIIGNLVGGKLVDVFGGNPIGYYVFSLSLVAIGVLIFVLSVPYGKKHGHELPDLTV